MTPTATPDPSLRPVASTFRAQNRGGGLYSELVSQHAGAWLAVAGHRLRLAPTVLTLAGLVIGVGASVVLILASPRFAPNARSGAIPAWGVALAVGLCWQLAYAFDCADGQLARVTGRTSGAGGRLDILCDVATQISIVAAVTAVAAVQAPRPPSWLCAVFAGTWMVNVVTSVLAHAPSAASLIRSTSAIVRLVKLIRDYGAVLALISLVLVLRTGWSTALIAALTAVNGLFLLASIAQSARASLAATDGPAGAYGPQ